MTTIETKIAKNGSKRYYVRENGKLRQISYARAMEIERTNSSVNKTFTLWANEKLIASVDEYIIDVDAAAEVEIELAAENETAETKIDKLFDAYETESGNKHLAHGYIATVYYQQGRELYWRGMARNYGTIDAAIDAINYVCKHDTNKIARTAAVFFKHSRFDEDKIYARNEFGVEYFTEYYNNAIVETDGSEEDDFADKIPALFPAEDSDDDNELIDPPTEVNTATCNGYIFTTYSTRTDFDSNGYTNDVEKIEFKCDTLGDADNFDGIYRELTFFNEDNKDGWEVKTADGKILAKGNTEADAIKARDIICNADAEVNTATTEVTNAPEVARFQTGKTYRYFDENSGKPLWYITIDKRTNTTVTVSGEKFKVFIQNHDRMLNYDKPTESFIRGNYRIDAADACEESADEITPATLQKFIEAKKEVSYWRNSTGARIWQIAYIRYGINGGVVGQTPWLNRTMKEADRYLKDEYGMTLLEYLAAEDKWNDTDKGAILKDKIDRDCKPSVEPMPAYIPTEDSDDDDELIDPPVDNNTVTDTTPEYKYYIKSRRPIFGAAPNGYIKAVSGEVHEPVRRPNGTYSPKCRIYFAAVIYDKPLTDEQIADYDLAVSNETFELLNATTAQHESPTTNTIVETDGSEEDDDDSEVFDLLPNVDELNDTRSDIEKEFDKFADEDTDRNDRYNRGEKIAADLTAKLRPFDPTVEVTFKIDYEYDEDGEDTFYLEFDGIRGTYCTATNAESIFHALKSDIAENAAEHSETEPSEQTKSDCAIANALDGEFQKVVRGNDYMDVTTQNGEHIVTSFGAAYIEPDWRAMDGYVFGNHYDDILARYETPAQVETVINQLKAAIERGDTEFEFPTIEELATPEIDKDATADSLTRAMTIALEHYQDYCRVGNLTAATNELSLYNICRKAMTEIWKEEAA